MILHYEAVLALGKLHIYFGLLYYYLFTDKSLRVSKQKSVWMKKKTKRRGKGGKKPVTVGNE